MPAILRVAHAAISAVLKVPPYERDGASDGPLDDPGLACRSLRLALAIVAVARPGYLIAICGSSAARAGDLLDADIV